jgi:hypothetical protein
MASRATIAPLLPLFLAMGLAGARADGIEGQAGGPDPVALQQEGSSVPPRGDPATNRPSPPAHPTAVTKPDNERVLMLMLLGRSTFGVFGRLGQ